VLPPTLIATQNQATYAVEVVNQRGHSAGLSNQVRTPLAPTAPPPADFRATLDEQGPLLKWDVQSSLAPSPGVSYRIRIYRRTHGKTDFAIISEPPYRIGEDEARDTNFEWEQEYDYKITSVTVLALPGRAAAEVEGDDSKVVSLLVHDVFPPAVPTGLQAVFSSVGQKPFIDLTWAPNTESDLAGYIVYRRTGASKFAAVTTVPVKAPAWRDNDVHPGEKYYYTVTAVDVRGNQSAQSAPADESVPLEVR
jgi:fibronectin type 3 domain-containing protein